MRIVVLDGFTLDPGDNPWEPVARLGDLTVHERSAPETVVERARGAEVVLTNKTLLDATTLARLDELRFVGVLATGYNVVDVGAARAAGIVVANVPEYGSDAVAQHTLALLLELTNHVGAHATGVAAGEWVRAPDFSYWHDAPVEVGGLTLGVVGMGRIGRKVAALGAALGMNVVGCGGTSGGDPDIAGFRWLDLDGLVAAADVVTLHCPLGETNERMADAPFFAAMKPSAFFINTARGGLVDEPALAQALERGEIAGAALDVVAVEPMREDNPLRAAARCLITPHMAWASLAARRRLMQITARNIEAYRAGNPINVVG